MTEQFHHSGPQHPSQPPSLSPKLQYLGAAVAVGLLVYLGSWAYELVTRDLSGVPVVRAAEGPLRVVPADRGAPSPEYQGLSVNDVVSGSQDIDEAPAAVALAPDPLPVDEEDLLSLADTQAAQQSIAPAPEAPALVQRAEPVVIAPVPEVDIPEATPTLSAQEAAELRANLNRILEKEGEETRPIETANMPATLDQPQLRPSNFPPPQQEAAPEPIITAQTAQSETLAIREEVPADEVPDDEFVAQLVVLGSVASAREEWDKIKARHEEYFSDKQRVIMEISRNGGVMYRLRVTGFADRDDARSFCQDIKARGQDCIATRMR